MTESRGNTLYLKYTEESINKHKKSFLHTYKNHKYPKIIKDHHLLGAGVEEGSIKKSNQNEEQGFPGGTVVKNPPAYAGDTGSIPGLGRSHMPLSN